MNSSLQRGLTLVAVYVLVLGASVLTGMVYTGKYDLSQWSQEMRNTIAGTPVAIVFFMWLLGIV